MDILFYSSSHKKIVTEYCGSLFVGHCTSDDLVNQFFHAVTEFMQKLKLNLSLLLALGMDGPSVNRSFEKRLKACLEENCATQILDIGTCSQHIVNNVFLDGLQELKMKLIGWICNRLAFLYEVFSCSKRRLCKYC